MDFVNSHLGKMQLWKVEHFFDHKMVTVFVVKKVFNFSELHLSDVTSDEIHILAPF